MDFRVLFKGYVQKTVQIASLSTAKEVFRTTYNLQWVDTNNVSNIKFLINFFNDELTVDTI